MKIGILDSGVGGLTVLRSCLREMPNHDYLYFADSENAPYGVKSKEEVGRLTCEAVEFLIGKGANVIVIACNTATSVAAEMLREKYDVPIIGMEPAIKPALDISRASGKRVLVTATELTLKGEKFLNLVDNLDGDDIIDFCSLSELVEYAEEAEFREEMIVPYLKWMLSSYDLNDYGSVVLGCTHFPLFKSMFADVLPEGVEIVDGIDGTVKALSKLVTSEEAGPDVKFYSTKVEVAEGSLFEKFVNILSVKV